MTTSVTLTRETPFGVETLLRNTPWRDAYCELFRVSATPESTYKIFDHDNDTLALIIPGLSLGCSRIERFQKLHKARKAYELNLEADVFRPAVEVA